MKRKVYPCGCCQAVYLDNGIHLHLSQGYFTDSSTLFFSKVYFTPVLNIKDFKEILETKNLYQIINV